MPGTLADVGTTDAHVMLITVATAIAAGVGVIIIARKLRLPGIVLLLAAGTLLGPAVWGDRAPVRPESLGEGLRVLVSLCVGLILFEGGLTLDIRGWRAAPSMINRLLTIGVLTTWLLTAGAIRLIVGQPAEYAVLAASLVIVTGPTVIGPLLKRIQVRERLHSILHWEGVLIDPIGVFIALLCFEYVVSGETGMGALANLGERVAAGLGLGIVGGVLITQLVHRRIVPEDMINVAALAGAVCVFGMAELIEPEAGLLSVTVAGFVFGLSGSFRVKQVREFKGELTNLLIGTLFILLSARLTFDQFQTFAATGFLVVGIVMLVVRPLSVFLCSIGVGLSFPEKVFLSWVAPRGIVAASMASLIAIEMGRGETASAARFVETFTYSVIIATILIQGTTAGALARVLRLRRPDPTGWLLVGAHALGRQVARFIQRTAGVSVVVADTNARAVREARGAGLVALAADARDVELRERAEVQTVGNLLALTDNDDLNTRLCQVWSKELGSGHVFRCNPTGAEPPQADDTDAGTGRIVWPRLARPSLIAGEIARGETVLRSTPAPGATGQSAGMVLLAATEGQVHFDPAPADLPAGATVLAMQRTADSLRRCLRPELIVRLEEVEDVEALFAALVDRVVTVVPDLPRDETVQRLLEQEASFPTALGHGVAVPHAYCEEIDARVCAIACVDGGVDFGAHDGERVALVFLILSPPGDPEGHLATLAEIARRVIRDEVRSRLVEARDAHEVMRIVHETA